MSKQDDIQTTSTPPVSMHPVVRRVHVIPVGDKDIHAAQMMCWCHPLEIHGGTIVHNAADCREKYERQTGEGYPNRGWVNIAEYVAPNGRDQRPSSPDGSLATETRKPGSLK